MIPTDPGSFTAHVTLGVSEGEPDPPCGLTQWLQQAQGGFLMQVSLQALHSHVPHPACLSAEDATRARGVSGFPFCTPTPFLSWKHSQIMRT